MPPITRRADAGPGRAPPDVTETVTAARSPVSDRLWRTLFAGLCLGALWIATTELETSRHFGPMIRLAALMRQELPVDRTAVERYTAEVGSIVEAGICRADVLRAGLTLTLRDLDHQHSASDYGAWRHAFEKAGRFIDHALACTPADGNLWLRSAMLRQAIGENPLELAGLLHASVQFAPSEISVLTARFQVWNTAQPETLALARASLEKDLATVLEYARPAVVVAILSNPSPALTPYLRTALRRISPTRRENLAAAGLAPDLVGSTSDDQASP